MQPQRYLRRPVGRRNSKADPEPGEEGGSRAWEWALKAKARGK